MPVISARMRKSAALFTAAVGIAAIGAAIVPTAASAATPQSLAASIVPADQLASFDQIISHESGWNVTAT
ncbi:lytic transglycosylase domain-containing protein, partial [Kitasatospora sp. NPDC048343]